MLFTGQLRTEARHTVQERSVVWELRAQGGFPKPCVLNYINVAATVCKDELLKSYKTFWETDFLIRFWSSSPLCPERKLTSEPHL